MYDDVRTATIAEEMAALRQELAELKESLQPLIAREARQTADEKHMAELAERQMQAYVNSWERRIRCDCSPSRSAGLNGALSGRDTFTRDTVSAVLLGISVPALVGMFVFTML